MEGKPKILIVEDERVVAEDIQRSLEQIGYTVPAIAGSGDDALKFVKQFIPDLILMDIVIRGSMTGIETAEKILADYDVPIVYLTAYADEKTLEEAKLTAPAGYILKPFNNRELQSTIEMAIYKHRTDQKLRENEAWLYTTLSSIGDGVIATDKKGSIRFVNKVALDLMGYSSHEIKSKNITDVFKIVDKTSGLPCQNLTFFTIQHGKTAYLKEGSVLLTRDGSTVPVDGNSSPIFDDRGKVAGAVKVFRDISARLRAEEAIRTSEEKYRTLFETIAQGVLYFNEHGEITSANPAAEMILGAAGKSLYGNSLFHSGMKIVKEDGKEFSDDEDPVHRCIRDRNTILNIVMGIMKGHTVFRWLLVDMTPQFHSPTKHLNAVVMSFSDITKRKQAELTLSYRNSQLRSLVYLAHEVSTTLEIRKILQKALNVLVEKTEFSAGSIYLMNHEQEEIEIEMHTETSPRVQNKIRELLRDKTSFYSRSLLNGNTKIYPLTQIIHNGSAQKSGAKHEKSINYCIAMPVQIDTEIEGVVNLIGKMKELPDISDDFISSIGLHLGLSLKNARLYEEIKDTLQKLQETQNKLIQSEKLAGLGALASNIVHEIGNPLAAIDNSIQVLQRKIKLEGRLEELMNIISWETERLIRTISELREFSKPRRLNFIESDMGDIVKKAISVLNQDVELIFGKKIYFNPPRELPEISVDPDAIEQVAINLIKNGLQAVKEGGAVQVQLKKNGKTDSSCVIFRVIDDGDGIPEENFKKIFEPYFSTKARGMGLGMHIVRTNVELHGGAIDIESSKGKGTVITVTIPYKRGDNGKNSYS